MLNCKNKIVLILLVDIFYLKNCVNSTFFDLYDERNNRSAQSVLKGKTSPCDDHQFQCKSQECIAMGRTCDGAENCADGSDESFETCASIICPSYTFKCSYGACIDSKLKCNGRADCADNSDESAIRCPHKRVRPNMASRCRSDQFKCKSATCIRVDLLCNGFPDCDDGSDESNTQCENIRCPLYAFRCDYGACVEEDNVQCNGIIQCVDGSDENETLCKNSQTSAKPIYIPIYNMYTPAYPPLSPDSCHLPHPSADKTFFVIDTNEKIINVGTLAPKFSVLDATCAEGRLTPDGKESFISICYKGHWEPPPKMCMSPMRK